MRHGVVHLVVFLSMYAERLEGFRVTGKQAVVGTAAAASWDSLRLVVLCVLLRGAQCLQAMIPFKGRACGLMTLLGCVPRLPDANP